MDVCTRCERLLIKLPSDLKNSKAATSRQKHLLLRHSKKSNVIYLLYCGTAIRLERVAICILEDFDNKGHHFECRKKSVRATELDISMFEEILFLFESQIQTLHRSKGCLKARNEDDCNNKD